MIPSDGTNRVANYSIGAHRSLWLRLNAVRSRWFAFLSLAKKLFNIISTVCGWTWTFTIDFKNSLHLLFVTTNNPLGPHSDAAALYLPGDVSKRNCGLWNFCLGLFHHRFLNWTCPALDWNDQRSPVPSESSGKNDPIDHQRHICLMATECVFRKKQASHTGIKGRGLSVDQTRFCWCHMLALVPQIWLQEAPMISCAWLTVWRTCSFMGMYLSSKNHW